MSSSMDRAAGRPVSGSSSRRPGASERASNGWFWCRRPGRVEGKPQGANRKVVARGGRTGLRAGGRPEAAVDKGGARLLARQERRGVESEAGPGCKLGSVPWSASSWGGRRRRGGERGRSGAGPTTIRSGISLPVWCGLSGSFGRRRPNLFSFHFFLSLGRWRGPVLTVWAM